MKKWGTFFIKIFISPTLRPCLGYLEPWHCEDYLLIPLAVDNSYVPGIEAKDDS